MDITKKGMGVPAMKKQPVQQKPVPQTPAPVEKQPVAESILRAIVRPVTETKRMSAAVKLSRAWDREHAKSTASRERGKEYMDQIKQQVADKDKKPEAPKEAYKKLSAGEKLSRAVQREKERAKQARTGLSGLDYDQHQAQLRALAGKKDQDAKEAMLPDKDFVGSKKNPINGKGLARGEPGKSQKAPLTGLFVGENNFDEAANASQQAAIAIDMQNHHKKPKKEEKIKGVDGKACWKGKRYAGRVKKADGTYKDKCVPVSEEVENIMSALIDKIIVNETISNNKRRS